MKYEKKTNTKRNNNIYVSRVVIMNKEIRVYYRLKGNMYKTSLAHHNTTYNRNTGEKLNEYISIFLFRDWDFYTHRLIRSKYWDWDEVFSHIVSHEYMHKAIEEVAGRKTNTLFDNIAGTVDKNPFQAGWGMNKWKCKK